MCAQHYDVVIIGGGLAGSTLARQLLMKQSGKSILHLEKRKNIPGRKQKVGESTVQVGGYYLSKTLDLEEYLHQEHLMKYNLRFIWPTAGRANDDIEDYSQGFIRNFSNIASYQVDRNKLEAELIRCNKLEEDYNLLTGVTGLKVTLGSNGDHHKLTWNSGQHAVSATWVVDTTGRKRLLTRNLKLKRECSELTHGSSWFWVDGIVNIEKLTRSSYEQSLLRPSRRAGGHLPYWLSTNSFMGEGYWIWVITLHGRTSIGVVYDQNVLEPARVSSASKLIDWMCEAFPAFGHAVKDMRVIDFTTLRKYSYDCVQTINKDRWAMSGEAARFTDPLYSPGSDAIAIHNTLIIDAVLTEDSKELEGRTKLFENMFKIVYRSFIPSFSASYRVLGDPESFYMKYTWELSIYFVFYVFPFVNQLFTRKHFLIPYFRRFSMLGKVNKNLLTYITAYYQWKKENLTPATEPAFTDFGQAPSICRAEKTFYEVGLRPDEAIDVINEKMGHLMEYARYLIAHIDSVVLDEPELVCNKAYVAKIDLETRVFDPQAMKTALLTSGEEEMPHEWSFCHKLMRKNFHRQTQQELQQA